MFKVDFHHSLIIFLIEISLFSWTSNISPNKNRTKKIIKKLRTSINVNSGTVWFISYKFCNLKSKIGSTTSKIINDKRYEIPAGLKFLVINFLNTLLKNK